MSRTNYRDWPTRILDQELLTKVVPSSKKLDMNVSSCSASEDKNKNGTTGNQRGNNGKFKSHTSVEDSKGLTASTTASDTMAAPSSLPQKQDLKKIQSKNTFTCTFCEVKFGSKYKYSLHKKREEHKILSGEVFSDILDKSKTSGTCPICGYFYSSRHCIVRHLRRALLLSGDKKCEFCLHTFKTEVNLKRHIGFFHAGSSNAQSYEDDPSFLDLVEKKGNLFRCKICLHSYKKKSMCIRHAEQCELCLKQEPTTNKTRKCSKKIIQESASEKMAKKNLQYEDVLYKNNDLYHCKFCGYTNTKRCRTLHHVFNTHEYCSICKIPFDDKAAYSDHINVVHNSVEENKYDVKDIKTNSVSSECGGKSSSDEDDDVLYSLNTGSDDVTKTDQSKTKTPKVNFETKILKVEKESPNVSETESSKVKKSKSPNVLKAFKMNKETSKMISPRVSLERIQDFGKLKPSGIWECKLCDDSRCLNDRNVFLRHLRLSHLLCTICFRIFKTNLVFKNHLLKKHNMNDSHLKVSFKRGKKKTVKKPCRNLKGSVKAIRLSNHRLKSKKGSYFTSGCAIKTRMEDEFSQKVSVPVSSQTFDSSESSGSGVSGNMDKVTEQTAADLAILNMIDTEKSLSVELVPLDTSNSVNMIKHGPSSYQPLPNKYKGYVQKPLLKITKIGNGPNNKGIIGVDGSEQEICEKSDYFNDTDSSEISELDVEVGTIPKTQNKALLIIEKPTQSLKYLSKKSKYTSSTNQPSSLQANNVLTTMPFVVLNKLHNINNMNVLKTNNFRQQKSHSKNVKRCTSKILERREAKIVSSQTDETPNLLQADDPIIAARTSDLGFKSSEVNDGIISSETLEGNSHSSNKKSGLCNLKVSEVVGGNTSIDPVGTEKHKNDINQRGKSSAECMKVKDNVKISPEIDPNENTDNDSSLKSGKMFMTAVDVGRPNSLQKGKRSRGRPPKIKQALDQVSRETIIESNLDDLSFATVTNNEGYKSEELTDINEEQNNSCRMNEEKDANVTCESDTLDKCKIVSLTTEDILTAEKTGEKNQSNEHSHQKVKGSRGGTTRSKLHNLRNVVDNSVVDVTNDGLYNKSENTDEQRLVEKDNTCDNDAKEVFKEDRVLNEASEVKGVKENVKVKDIKEVKLVSAQNLQKYGYEMLEQKLPVVKLTRIHKSSSLDSIENLSNQSEKNNEMLKSVYSLRRKSKEDRNISVDEKGDADVAHVVEHQIVKVDGAKYKTQKQSVDMSLSVESEDEGMCTEDEIDGSLISELGMHEVNEEFLDSSLSSMNDELFNDMPFLDESILNAEFEMIEDLSNDVSVYDQVEIEEKNGRWETFHKSCPSPKTLALGLLSCLQLTSATRSNGHTDLVDDVNHFEGDNLEKSGSLTDCSDIDTFEKDNNDNYEISNDLNKNLKELQASVLLVRKTKKHAKLKSLKKLSDKKLTSKKYSNFLAQTSCKSGEANNDGILDADEKVQNDNKGALIQEEAAEKQVMKEAVDVAMETELTEGVKPDKRNEETVVLEPVYTLNTVLDNSLVKVGTTCVLSNNVTESIQKKDNAGDEKRTSTFACNWCKKSYKNKHSLQIHKRKKHSSQISLEKDSLVIQGLDKIEDSIVGPQKHKCIIQTSDKRQSKDTGSSVTIDIIQKPISVDEKTNIFQNEDMVTIPISSTDNETKASVPVSFVEAGKSDKVETDVLSLATNVSENDIVKNSGSMATTKSSVTDVNVKLSTVSKTKDNELYIKGIETKSSISDKSSSGIYHVCKICGLKYRAPENLSIHLRTCHNIIDRNVAVTANPDSVSLNPLNGLVNETQTSSKVTTNSEVQLHGSVTKEHSGSTVVEAGSDEIIHKDENHFNHMQISDQADLDLKNMVVDIEKADFQVSMETDLNQTESLIDKITAESENIIQDSNALSKHSECEETVETNIDTVDSSEVQPKIGETTNETIKSLNTSEEKNNKSYSSNKSPFKSSTFPVRIKFEKSVKGKKKSPDFQKSDQNTLVKKKRGRPSKRKDITLVNDQDLLEFKMNEGSKESSYLEERKNNGDKYQEKESQNMKTDQNQLEINSDKSDDIPYVTVKSKEEVTDKKFKEVQELGSSVVATDNLTSGQNQNLQSICMSPSKNMVNSKRLTPKKSPNVSPSKQTVNSQSPISRKSPNVSPIKTLMNSLSPNSKKSPNLNVVKRASTFEDSYVSFLKAASNTPPDLQDSNSQVEDNEVKANWDSTVLDDQFSELKGSRENLDLGEKHKKQKCSVMERTEITTDSLHVIRQKVSEDFSDVNIPACSAVGKHQENDSSVNDSSQIKHFVDIHSPTKHSVEVTLLDKNCDSDATSLEQDNLYKIDSELGNKTQSQTDKMKNSGCSSTDSVIDVSQNVLDSNEDEVIELNNMVTSVHLVRLPENKKVFKFGSTKLKRKRRINGTVWKILNDLNYSTEKSVQVPISMLEQENDIVTEKCKEDDDGEAFRTGITESSEEKEPKASCKKFKKKYPEAGGNDNVHNKTQTTDGGKLNDFEMALEASMKIDKKKIKKKKRLEKQLSVDSTESKQESEKNPAELAESTESNEQTESVLQKSDGKSTLPLRTGFTSKIVRKILRDKELEKEKNSEINLFNASDIKSFEETIAKTDAKNKSEGELNKKVKKFDTKKDNNDVLKSLYGVGTDRKIFKSFRKTSNDSKLDTEYRRRSPLDYGDFGGESSGLKFKMTNDMLDLSVPSTISAGDSETQEDSGKTTEGIGSNDSDGQKKKDLLKLMEGLIEEIDSAKKNRNEISFGSERRVRFRDTEESSDAEFGRVGLIAGRLSQNTDFFKKFHVMGSRSTSPLKTPFSSPFLKRKEPEESILVEKAYKIPKLAVQQQVSEKIPSEKAISNFLDNIRVEVGIDANSNTKRKVNLSLETEKNKDETEFAVGNVDKTLKTNEYRADSGEITERDIENGTLDEKNDMTVSWQQDVDEDQGCMEGVDTSDCWQQEIEKNKEKGADLDFDGEEELDFEEEIENEDETEQNQDIEDDISNDGESESGNQNPNNNNTEKQAKAVLDLDNQNSTNQLDEKVHKDEKQNEDNMDAESMAIENTEQQVHNEDSNCKVDDKSEKNEELTRTNDNDEIEEDVDKYSEKEEDSDADSDIVTSSVRKGRGYDSDNSSDADKDEDAISFYAGDESLSVMEFEKEEKQESHKSDEDHEKSNDESDAEEKGSASDEEEREQENTEDKKSDDDDDDDEQENTENKDSDDDEQENTENKDSDDDEHQNMETMSVCSTSHSVRSRRSVLSRKSGTNDLDCIQLCVSDDEDASFLNDGVSDISSGERCSSVDDEMTTKGEDENADMEIADTESIVNADIQVNHPPLQVTQNTNGGMGNLTKQLVPWKHCFFFLTNRCTRKDCQFIHEKLNKEDIIRYWLNNLEKSLYKGNTKGIFESYKNVKTLNGQQPIPAERVTSLFKVALQKQDIDVVFKLCSDMSTHKLLDCRYCNEVIQLCHKQPSMYADKLYHLFEIIKNINGRLTNESLNILLSSFLNRSDWTKLWIVLQYCNEIEDFFPPVHIIQKACDAAIKQPNQYMIPMMKWLNECETSKLEELDPKLLHRIQSEVKKIPVNTVLKKHVDVAAVIEDIEFSQKEAFTTVTDSENHVEDNCVLAEDYKHYRHRIHGCHITKNWDYLGSIFYELCNSANCHNKNFLDAYVEALWDKNNPENLASSLSDFITSVDKTYQNDKQEDVLAVLDEGSLTLICSKLLYRIYDEELWRIGYEVISVICHKQIPCQKYSIPNRKNIIQVIVEICLNNGAPVDAFQIMLGTRWQILETNIFSKNSKEILKTFSQLLQQLIESNNLKESCTFLAALLTKADNDSKVEILNSEIEFTKAFDKIITDGLSIGNTQIAVAAYECYMNSSLKTSLSLASLRSLLASCGDCGDYDKAMQLYERLRDMKIYVVQNVSSIPRYIILTSILTPVEINYVISDYLNIYYNYLCEKQMDGIVLTYEDLKLAVLMEWYPPQHIPCLEKWTFQSPNKFWATVIDILQNTLLTPLTGNLFPDQSCFEISPPSLESYLKAKDQKCIRQGLHFVPINKPRIPKPGIGAGRWGRQGRHGRPYRRK